MGTLNPPTLLELGVLELPPLILLHLFIVKTTSETFAPISYLCYFAAYVQGVQSATHQATEPRTLGLGSLSVLVFLKRVEDFGGQGVRQLDPELAFKDRVSTELWGCASR